MYNTNYLEYILMRSYGIASVIVSYWYCISKE